MQMRKQPCVMSFRVAVPLPGGGGVTPPPAVASAFGPQHVGVTANRFEDGAAIRDNDAVFWRLRGRYWIIKCAKPGRRNGFEAIHPSALSLDMVRSQSGHWFLFMHKKKNK